MILLHSLIIHTSILASEYAEDTSTLASCDDINLCRSKSQIVYSCLATVFACVWVAVHPSLPTIADPVKGKRHALGVWTVNQCVDVGTTILAILLPEFTLAISAGEWSQARELMAKLNEVSPKGSTSAFARKNQSGKAMLFYDGLVIMPGLDWSETHAFFVIMGGFQTFEGDSPLRILTPTNVISLVKDGAITAPLEDDIWALSKAGPFSKACALFQTVWFVAQCIARRLQHLPLAQLEVAALAYTVMTAAMYCFWWNKPMRVERPIRVHMEGRGKC